MAIKRFNTFREAANFAKQKAIIENESVKIVRDNDEFCVLFVATRNTHQISDAVETNDNLYEFDTMATSDFDYEKTMREIREELLDYTDSVARSNEEGWFYDESDGSWENSLVDPKSRYS